MLSHRELNSSPFTNHAFYSDFADEHPDAQVIGTDLSPIQPIWVPPNVKFEVDDATLSWTWPADTFDFVHMRYLFGAIIDWPALFREAIRCCKPGGWVQSAEVDVEFKSDDGTVDSEPILTKWAELYREGGQRTGRSFAVLEDKSQTRGMEDAGFKDIQVVNFKVFFFSRT
jgi:ubiquinone/menaquinone biosynthesis C-methylase UbiE